MSIEESLQDVTIRERQLEALSFAPPNTRNAPIRTLKRLVLMLYSGHFTSDAYSGAFCLSKPSANLRQRHRPVKLYCASWCPELFSLNPDQAMAATGSMKAWLAPQEKVALEALKVQRHEILTRLPRNSGAGSGAELN